MHELTLEPLALLINWSMENPLSQEEWETILCQYMDTLTKKISCEENAVVGHIKAFAKMPDGGFIQTSKVSANSPASTSTKNLNTGLWKTLEISLNILVYGVAADKSLKIAVDTARKISDVGNGTIQFQQISGHASHNSVHHAGDHK